MLGQTTEYALRAVVWLATHPERVCKADEIAAATQIPASYVPKVMQALVRADVVESQPGPKGGFTLQRPSDELSVLDVVNAIDPIPRIRKCPLGLSDHAQLCPLHARLDAARAMVEDAFRQCTIAELTENRTGVQALCPRPGDRP